MRVEAENLLTGVRRHTNTCYLTFVALDDAGRPVPVPAVAPETEEEWRRFREAEVRRAQRVAEIARRQEAR
ncbi:MAG: hypothetical protein B7Z72_06995 [Gemmatimonadetes bacterium 21-71-4]|nr:MAG: hypothetical protein B7Z72_06995 [Gemmatimonadetes bacterium 21-71-4]